MQNLCANLLAECVDGLFEGVVIQVENIDVKDAETGQISIDYHAVFIPAHLSEEDIQAISIYLGSDGVGSP